MGVLFYFLFLFYFNTAPEKTSWLQTGTVFFYALTTGF